MKILVFIFMLFTLIGCGKDDGVLIKEICFVGTVIGPEKCSGATIIQINNNSRDIGGEINYYDSLTVKNTIRVPGQFMRGKIYFTVRKFHRGDDALFKPIQHCPAIYAPFDIPTFVITSHSTTNCPAANEN